MYLDRIIPFTMPTNIIHGTGAAKLIPAECKRLGVKKVLLVTDEGLVKAGVVKEVTDILEESKIPYVVYDKVEVDPVMKTVNEGEKASPSRRVRRDRYSGRRESALRRKGDCRARHKRRKDRGLRGSGEK